MVELYDIGFESFIIAANIGVLNIENLISNLNCFREKNLFRKQVQVKCNLRFQTIIPWKNE